MLRFVQFYSKSYTYMEILKCHYHPIQIYLSLNVKKMCHKARKSATVPLNRPKCQKWHNFAIFPITGLLWEIFINLIINKLYSTDRTPPIFHKSRKILYSSFKSNLLLKFKVLAVFLATTGTRSKLNFIL